MIASDILVVGGGIFGITTGAGNQCFSLPGEAGHPGIANGLHQTRPIHMIRHHESLVDPTETAPPPHRRQR